MMDELDRKILNMVQSGFPVEAEPFRVIAGKLGTSEDEVITRVRRLKEAGVIRRIGAVFEPRNLGFVSTLCAARVPEDLVERFVETVNSLKNVTHNYRRTHEYNIWFTLTCPGEDSLEQTLQQIKTKTGVHDILSMRAVKVFKINTNFEV
jgi:DNA-binding Lrp family transcriptional regulator